MSGMVYWIITPAANFLTGKVDLPDLIRVIPCNRKTS